MERSREGIPVYRPTRAMRVILVGTRRQVVRFHLGMLGLPFPPQVTPRPCRGPMLPRNNVGTPVAPPHKADEHLRRRTTTRRRGSTRTCVHRNYCFPVLNASEFHLPGDDTVRMVCRVGLRRVLMTGGSALGYFRQKAHSPPRPLPLPLTPASTCRSTLGNGPIRPLPSPPPPPPPLPPS